MVRISARHCPIDYGRPREQTRGTVAALEEKPRQAVAPPGQGRRHRNIRPCASAMSLRFINNWNRRNLLIGNGGHGPTGGILFSELPWNLNLVRMIRTNCPDDVDLLAWVTVSSSNLCEMNMECSQFVLAGCEWSTKDFFAKTVDGVVYEPSLNKGAALEPKIQHPDTGLVL
jgi:hypothetical protein